MIKLGIVMDPISEINIKKDSSFAMLMAAQERGYQLFYMEMADLAMVNGVAMGNMRPLKVINDANKWFELGDAQDTPLSDLNVVLMRKDPPFDSEFFYATHLLSQATREGAKVFNNAQALREHPEKLAILEFPQFISPTLVTRNAQDIKDFHQEHQDIILKPLDGMGGTGIFRVPANGLNLGAIIETLNRYGQQTVMVQKFIPQIKDGDKRVLLIGGEVVPFCLARIPQAGEVRGNLASGGKGVAQPLTQQELNIAQELAPLLAARGLHLVGLDFIGGYLTEINVTSPTCFVEITEQTGHDVALQWLTNLEKHIQ